MKQIKYQVSQYSENEEKAVFFYVSLAQRCQNVIELTQIMRLACCVPCLLSPPFFFFLLLLLPSLCAVMKPSAFYLDLLQVAKRIQRDVLT